MATILHISVTAAALVAQLSAAGGPTSRPGDVPGGPALSLAQAEQNALRYQPAVRHAQGQTEAAAGRVEEARAGYLPQVTGTGTYERTTANFVSRPGTLPNNINGMPIATTAGPSISWAPSYTLYSFGITGSQLIYDFNATADRWRAAAANRDAAQWSERVARLQALLNVRRAYFTARAQRDLARVAEEAVANQQKHLDQIVDMVRAGMKSQIDLATQRTALANSRVQAVIAENTYAADLALLNQTMGLPSESAFELTDTEMRAVPGEDDDERRMIDGAIQTRPEVASADQQRRAQELVVSSDRGGFGPALSAIGSITDVGPGWEKLTPNWFVGASLSWAILQGGLTTGQVREAKGTLAALAAQADSVRLQVSIDVVQGRLAVRGAKSSIDGAEEALTNAREQLRLAEARYHTGQGSIIELADAQVAYTTAEAQEVSARYSLASARAQLLTAMGDK
ncbi:MAG TPA: TolC family protein [Polyangia bacterium]|nr:TolC family protein [Polyangia bacterium]